VIRSIKATGPETRGECETGGYRIDEAIGRNAINDRDEAGRADLARVVPVAIQPGLGGGDSFW
jgi:hypothetical protein